MGTPPNLGKDGGAGAGMISRSRARIDNGRILIEEGENRSPFNGGVEYMSIPKDAQEMFGRIQQAETGGLGDPFIRTMYRDAPGGSSAYGPVQITKGLAEGFKRNHADLFDADEIAYLDRFIEQGKKFLKYGNQKNLPTDLRKYDYGGEGDLTSPEDKEMYQRVATKMINYYWEKYGGDAEKVGNAWRYGEASSQTMRNDDSRYFKIVTGNETA